MPVARLTLAKPRPGDRQKLPQIFKDLDDASRLQAGFVRSYVFTSPMDPGFVGRLAIYKNRADLDHAATQSHIVTLRSEILRCVQESHTEQIVDVTETTP